MTNSASKPLVLVEPDNIFGPYSKWPRDQKPKRKAILGFTGAIAGLGVLLHCVVPLIA